MKGLYAVKVRGRKKEPEINHKFYAHIVEIKTDKRLDTREFQAVNMQDGFNAINVWLDQEHPAFAENDAIKIEISIYNL